MSTKILTLTAAHRCDRCGAQAYIAAQMAADSPDNLLLFCAHHGRLHLDKLRECAVRVQDNTDRLDEESKPRDAASATN